MSEEYKHARFKGVFNDDMSDNTFIYFTQGTIQDLSGGDLQIFKDEFCIHLKSEDVDRLKSALANEPNENTVFTPKEMVIIKRLVASFVETRIAYATIKTTLTMKDILVGSKLEGYTDADIRSLLEKLE